MFDDIYTRYDIEKDPRSKLLDRISSRELRYINIRQIAQTHFAGVIDFGSLKYIEKASTYKYNTKPLFGVSLMLKEFRQVFKTGEERVFSGWVGFVCFRDDELYKLAYFAGENIYDLWRRGAHVYTEFNVRTQVYTEPIIPEVFEVIEDDTKAGVRLPVNMDAFTRGEDERYRTRHHKKFLRLYTDYIYGNITIKQLQSRMYNDGEKK